MGRQTACTSKQQHEMVPGRFKSGILQELQHKEHETYQLTLVLVWGCKPCGKQ